MFVIFNDSDGLASGDSLQDALDDWKEGFGHYPDLKYLTIVKGVKQKLTLSLEPIIEKPAAKSKSKGEVK